LWPRGKGFGLERFGFIVTERYELSADELVTPGLDRCLPGGLKANTAGVIEQADGLRGFSKSRVLAIAGMIRRQQQLLSMENGRVERIRVSPVAHCAGLEVHGPDLAQPRKRRLEKMLVVQQRKTAGIGFEFYHIVLLLSLHAGQCLSAGDVLQVLRSKLVEGLHMQVSTLRNRFTHLLGATRWRHHDSGSIQQDSRASCPIQSASQAADRSHPGRVWLSSGKSYLLS